MEIVSTSEKAVTVRQGESLDLFCDSATPYQVSRGMQCTVRQIVDVAVVLLGAQWVRISDNLAQRRRGDQVRQRMVIMFKN